jgi:SAM-dependent methyltransferase
VERIVSASPGPGVLDVGCGTGIAARQLQAAGCTVLGVEPDARMADFARRTGIEVEVATFEAWDSAGRTFDAVIAGTAWHWVDPVTGAAKAAQVLRPGGLLAVFGHVFELPPQVRDAFGAVYQRVAPDSPFTSWARQARPAVDAYQAMYARAADGIREAGGFGGPEQCRFDWERSYTRDEWLDLMPTQGALTRLSPGRLAEVLAGVGAAIDAMGGSFTMPYATMLVTAVRTGVAPSYGGQAGGRG